MLAHSTVIFYGICLLTDTLLVFYMNVMFFLHNNIRSLLTLCGILRTQWVFGLPVIYYTTITLGHGLPATWFWINVPYAGMNLCLIIMFLATDWKAAQAKVHEKHRNENEKDVIDHENGGGHGHHQISLPTDQSAKFNAAETSPLLSPGQ